MQCHVDELEATIASCEALRRPAYAALTALARTLAAQMQEAGSQPSTRLSAAYLSVLKDIARVVASTPAVPVDGKVDRLRKMRASSLRPVEMNRRVS